ncbi:hypothetical protein [Mitsuaria sp. 7]|uniref:hypothetical protein n=1 Tax=Mitsuaria sp. 7 TaxID=1658665 RepID=UPI00083561DF|nr:hypothetical protein [Mitsuaria sp. 7]
MPFFLLALLTGLLLPFHAFAAGGHHAVDDAAIVDSGQCNLELWAERANLDRRQLQHAGLGCNLSGVEVGLNADRETARGASSLHMHGVQLKWATGLRPQLSIGLVTALGWQDQTPRAQQSLLVPLTWTPREDLAIHLNLGRTLLRHADDRTQRGIAVEWQMTQDWQGLSEYFHDGRRPLTRLGLRRTLSDRLTLDLSFAKTTATARAPKEGWWTIGANWTFGQ